MCVEEHSFLYCLPQAVSIQRQSMGLCSRLLKLVIGVEISTRPASSLDSEGNATKSNSLRAVAVPNSEIFRRSMTMTRP